MVTIFGFYLRYTVQNHINSIVVEPLRGTSIKYIEHIIEASAKNGMDPALVAAVIAVESNFKPTARSYAGAKGLMQINNVTARHLKVKDIYDPKTNINAGVYYLSELSEMFSGKTELMLAAYNAGPSTVKKFKGVPPYKQTARYIQKVMNLFHIYKSHPDFDEYI